MTLNEQISAIEEEIGELSEDDKELVRQWLAEGFSLDEIISKINNRRVLRMRIR